MTSTLIVTRVENIQKIANATVKSFKGAPGVYVSLNKTHKKIDGILQKEGISTKKLFFIDCISPEKTREDTLYIHPTELEKLSSAINTFINEIEGDKFLVIDALSTLLIYNDENRVARFIEEVTALSSCKNVEVIALSPKTKGEELLNKIFNFFDNVKKE